MRLFLSQVTRCLQGFVDIYKGRETRHRAKSLAHATEFEFRLKVGSSLSSGQAVGHAVTLCKEAQRLGQCCKVPQLGQGMNCEGSQ